MCWRTLASKTATQPATSVNTAWQTTIKVVTTGILAALLVGAAIKLKLMGGVQ